MIVLAIPILCLAAWANALNDPAPDLPTFGKPLNNLTISVGREAIFTCIVENLGHYKVAWLRVDTQTILTIASHVITKNHRITVTHSGHRTWSLHIRDTRETDRGWYMCQVNTDPMSSNTGFLEVVVPPDILDYPTSTDMVVREGSNVTLRCAATGTPEPTVTWRRETGGTITLSNWRQVTSAEGTDLEITRVTRLHMGPYLCIASNGVPPTVSKRIVLIVHFPPMVWIENQLVGAYEGQKLKIECHSEAYPRPITYWTRPTNETIVNDNNYLVEEIPIGYESTMKLTINSVRNQDFGSFRCVATNSLGETDGKIKLYMWHCNGTTCGVPRSRHFARDPLDGVGRRPLASARQPLSTYKDRCITNVGVLNWAAVLWTEDYILVTLVLFVELAKPATTGKPNSRRDSKKSWTSENENDKKNAGMMDDTRLNENGEAEDSIDFHSATSSTCFHRRYTNIVTLVIVSVHLLRGPMLTT